MHLANGRGGGLGGLLALALARGGLERPCLLLPLLLLLLRLSFRALDAEVGALALLFLALILPSALAFYGFSVWGLEHSR